MDAIAKTKAAPGLELVDAPMPEVGINDVLIKIRKTAICGTDLHIDKWDAWSQSRVPVGITIGHEFVGEIAEVGSNVDGLKVGERVSAEGHLVCGRCRHCLAGRRHLCPNTKGIGYDCDGAFAEFISVPACNVWQAPENLSDDEIACFDPFGNSVHTALSFDLVGEDVLIGGGGPIGCMAAAICKEAGARNIVVLEINPYRMKIAEQMGATRVVNEREHPLKDVMKELGMTEGFDVGLEMSGAPSVLSSMIDHMLTGGHIGLLGILPDGAPIDWTKVVFKSLRLQGIYGRKIFDTWYKAAALIQRGLDLKPIITHHFHYKEFRKAFDLMHSGKSGKIVLEWS